MPGLKLRDRLPHRWFSTLAVQFAILGFGVLGGIASGRLLGPEGRGSLAAIVLWPAALVLLVSLGMNQSIVFFTAKRRFPLTEIFAGSALIGLLQSVTVILAGWLLMPVLLRRYTPVERHLYFGLLCTTPFIVLAGYIGNLFQGDGDLHTFNTLRVLPSAIYSLGLLVLLLKHLDRLSYAVIIQGSAYVVSFCFALTCLRKIVRPAPQVKSNVLSALATYGAKSHVGTIASYLNQRVDQLILSLLIAPFDLGLYAVATTMAGAAAVAPSAIGLLAFTHGSRQTEDQLKGTIVSSLRYSILCGFMFGIPLFLFARPLTIFFLGSKFAGSVLACRILIPGVIGYGANQVLYSAAYAMEQPLLPSRAELAGLIVTVAGLALLAPYYGFLGAAVVSTLGYLTSFVVMIYLASTKLRLRASDFFSSTHRLAVAENG